MTANGARVSPPAASHGAEGLLEVFTTATLLDIPAGEDTRAPAPLQAKL